MITERMNKGLEINGIGHDFVLPVTQEVASSSLVRTAKGASR